MQLINQGDHDSLCGHACVAMLANTSIEAVAAALGHTRPTQWLDIYSLLYAFGVVAAPELVPVFNLEALPPVAIVLMPSGSPVQKHMAVVEQGQVFDPAHEYTYPVEHLPFCDRPSSDVLRCAAIRNARYSKAVVLEES